MDVVLFRVQLQFVVTHEYTDHVHGHVTVRPDGTLSNEINGEGGRGNFEDAFHIADPPDAGLLNITLSVVSLQPDRLHAVVEDLLRHSA